MSTSSTGPSAPFPHPSVHDPAAGRPPQPAASGRRSRPAGMTSMALVALVAAGGLLLGGCATPSSAASDPTAASAASDPTTPAAGTSGGSVPSIASSRTIVVRAVGKVTGTPDTMTINIGVATSAGTASKALEDNNAKANAVIGVLKGKGVAPADLQTSGLTVSPTYDSNGNSITGYQVTNSLTVTLHDLASAGAVIDAAQAAAGDAARIDSLSFSIDDASSLRAAARADAVKQATASAKQLAAAGGVGLGALLSITEDPQTDTTPVYAAADSAAGGVPIQAGSQDLTVTVEVVFAIS